MKLIDDFQNPEKNIWSKSLGSVKQAQGLGGFTLYTFTPNDPKILEREREPRISRKKRVDTKPGQ
jgi:hypothetical protein